MFGYKITIIYILLERVLDIVETEVVRISREHSQLDNLLEERLENIKLLVDYTSPLAPKIERNITIIHYIFSRLSITNIMYGREIKLLDKCENLALKIRNKSKDLKN